MSQGRRIDNDKIEGLAQVRGSGRHALGDEKVCRMSSYGTRREQRQALLPDWLGKRGDVAGLAQRVAEAAVIGGA